MCRIQFPYENTSRGFAWLLPWLLPSGLINLIGIDSGRHLLRTLLPLDVASDHEKPERESKRDDSCEPPTMGPVFEEDEDSGVGDAGRGSLEDGGPEVAVEIVADEVGVGERLDVKIVLFRTTRPSPKLQQDLPWFPFPQ